MPQAWNFIKKETLAQIFSCELREISKNTFFIEHIWWPLLERLRQKTKKTELYVYPALKEIMKE